MKAGSTSSWQETKLPVVLGAGGAEREAIFRQLEIRRAQRTDRAFLRVAGRPPGSGEVRAVWIIETGTLAGRAEDESGPRVGPISEVADFKIAVGYLRLQGCCDRNREQRQQ
jgi:hypothetical protein